MLRYAATPSCLALGLLNLCTDGADPICRAMGHGSWLGGMATMYFMMALFHAAPWLRLLVRLGAASPTGSSTRSPTHSRRDPRPSGCA